MLIPISQLNREDASFQFTAMLRGYCAICLETGAHLSRSRGRTSKAPKYTLILPNKSIEERGGIFANYDWDYPTGRKFVRAWSDEEAIELANKKLERMLAERQS